MVFVAPSGLMKTTRSQATLHEDLGRHQTVEGSSNRSFGLVFAAFFTLLAVAPLRHHHSVRPSMAVAAAAFLVCAMAWPRALAPLNALWLRLGLLLGKVVTPITLGVMFFGVFTPVHWLLRVARKDLLRLRKDPAAKTYWTPRGPDGDHPGDGMARQF